MSKILVVDDHESLVETVKYNLVKVGHQVFSAFNGLDAIEQAKTARPDLVVLDLMLPDMDGFDLCRALRSTMKMPILILSAKDEEFDVVLGLELGADDYMKKPFSLREFLDRVKAMLRRAGMAQEESDRETLGGDSGEFWDEGLEIDFGRRSVKLKGAAITLKPKEYELLVFLIKNRGQVLTRDVLLDRVWGTAMLARPGLWTST